MKHWTKRRWTGAIAAMLAIAILGAVLLHFGIGVNGNMIAQARYPDMAPYPSGDSSKAYDAWLRDVTAQQRDLGDTSSLQAFFTRSSRTFLRGAAGKNRVFSPLNVYMALGILAQITGGESREQILALLDSNDLDALGQQANDIWNANYRDDGALTCILANSLWLNKDVKFNRDIMDTLAKDFYASSYQGEMGSEQFTQDLQNWLNEQTGGLLKEQAGGIELEHGTLLALASTVYFKAKWDYAFSEGSTAPQTFHAPAGDVETDFMHQQTIQSYCWGDKFSAVSQDFEEGGAMWFLLPDEDVSPESLLSDGEAMDFLFAADKSEWKNQEFLTVNKSVPRFDVTSQFELGEGLRTLGVTGVFDPAQADFSPLSADQTSSAVLSQASHAVRVTIDEEGCEAAAFTVMAFAGGTGPRPNGEVDFVLDRPFIFCITGDSGLPLFVGIVNSPAEN